MSHSMYDHVVIIPLLKCKYKDSADVNNYRIIAIATSLSKVLEQVLLSRLVRYLWTADIKLVSSKYMGQKWPYLHSSKQCIFTEIITRQCTCAFLMQKRHLIELIIGRKETVEQKCAVAYCEIVYLLV